MAMAIKTYVYKTVDSDQQLEVDVHYVATKSANDAPIALIIHGGGFCTGAKEHVPSNQIETLLELGFVAVSVNYRLCPTISLYDGPLTDCKDCYAWCKTSLPSLLKKDTGISIDPRRLVTMGHSAGGTLALLMATNPEPPLAILDFYGAKYFPDDFSDNFWFSPNPAIPQGDFPEQLINKIWSEIPPPTSAMLRQSEIAGQRTGTSASQPRNAYLFSGCANGTLLRLNTKDGKYERIDPCTFFTVGFPPVFFIHGVEDRVVPVRFSERAYADLKGMGVVTELRLVVGKDHAFDEELGIEDADFDTVREGLEFLAKYAQAGSMFREAQDISK